MNKKRFVEFYLAAMLKAATGGKVTKLVYQYEKGGKRLLAREYIMIEAEGGSRTPVTVTDYDLLAIALEVVKAVQVL